jgi:hypothetical protein
MKRLLLSVFAALMVAGCGTPTVFQPATGPNSVGYSEFRIEPGRYRVNFRGGSGASPQQVMDLALMRAAALTISQGYDWFRISDRYVQGAGGGYGPTIGLGVGGMSFGGRSAVGGSVSTGFDLSGGPALVATIEVLMGRGPMPPGLDVYNARAVNPLGAPPPPPPPPPPPSNAPA